VIQSSGHIPSNILKENEQDAAQEYVFGRDCESLLAKPSQSSTVLGAGKSEQLNTAGPILGVDTLVVCSNGNEHPSDDVLRVTGLQDKLIPEVVLLKADKVFGGSISVVVKAPFVYWIAADFE
jgi:hypothetical protein